ncbi:Importin subunit alpha-4 [Spatholobus suberectus]|nr:Importin subunit alpha-4 [Spatholobus suberectus]
MRKKYYKRGTGADQSRRRREDNLVEIRKNKPEETLLKKRRESYAGLSHHKLLETIPAMAQRLWSDNPATQLEATAHFRHMLAIVGNPPIDKVIKAGVVLRFAEFLASHDAPQLQLEAVWALTNTASGTSKHTTLIIELGLVPLSIKLLNSSDSDVRDQVRFALPVLRILIQFVKDEEVLTNECWALYHLSHGPIDNIQPIINTAVCPKLMELLLHPSDIVIVPALRTLANIAFGNDAQTPVETTTYYYLLILVKACLP